MSCLGQCGDCKCEEANICGSATERNAQMDKKLKVLKDYSCLLASTTCVNLPKRVAQYAYFSWCFLRDLTEMVKDTNARIDNLCEVAKCQDKKIEALAEALNAKASTSVSYKLRSGGSRGADGEANTYTTVEVDNSGSFKVKWNMMADSSTEVGRGVITGKINATFTANKDGSIKASVKSFTIQSVKYDYIQGSAVARSAYVSVFNDDGQRIYNKVYDPLQSWSESPNSTHAVNRDFTLQPNGGTSGYFNVFSTEEMWVANATKGYVQAELTNNSTGPQVSFEPCNIKCGPCENREV